MTDLRKLYEEEYPGKKWEPMLYYITWLERKYVELEDENAKLLKDILSKMICETAGLVESPFAYFWTEDWKKLKACMEAKIASVPQTGDDAGALVLAEQAKGTSVT